MPTTTPAVSQQEDDQGSVESIEHRAVIFPGELPGPNGKIPEILHKTSPALQKKQASELFGFLADENSALLELNADTTPRVALINIPQTSKVRVVFGLGFGSQGLGQVSAISQQLLMLHGDGGGETGGIPSALVLPRSATTHHNINVMTVEQFSQKITEKGKDYAYPLLPRNKISSQAKLMQICPIPAYLVYDGFTTDLDAADVCERILSMETAGDYEDMFLHAQVFLLACLSSHNVSDAKPYVPPPTLMARIPPIAQSWATSRFALLFPTLANKPQQTPPAQAPPTQHTYDPNLAKILETLIPHLNRSSSNTTPQQSEESDTPPASDAGMSKQELAATLEMCGLPTAATAANLPEWFLLCSEKGNSEQFKLQIIRKHIMNNTQYDDAEVPLTSVLLKMALKRNWAGKDGNIKRPSLIHAADGLSPFLVIDLDEDEVANINDESEALAQASNITVADIQKLKKKFVPKVPASAEDFMLLLKRFANLLYALFSDDCTYYKCVNKVISALQDYSKPARDSLSMRTKASILWILLLQGRQFSIGNMAVLAEFQTLHTCLTSKQGSITHAEVPSDLFKDAPAKRPNTAGDTNPNDNKKAKIEHPPPKVKNPNTWHPILKAKLGTPMYKAKFPTFSKILTYCGTDVESIFKRDGKTCAPNAVTGRCYKRENCPRDHTMITEDEANRILPLVQKFIDNPTGIIEG